MMEFIVKIVAVIGIIGFIAFCTAIPAKWCWNYTMPYIFGLPRIGGIQAFCLIFLASTLIKGTTYKKD